MSKKKQDCLDTKLDSYEKEIENALPESLEELPATNNLSEELAFAKEASANYLRKDTKINIRLSHYDVEGLRRLAAREGLPYQTFIASILHKYIAHHLQTKT
jgi:predicted DNA binding CopG/RHH family protein